MPTKSPASLLTERWLVTGALGFIGSHFARLVLAERPNVELVNLDAVSYCGNIANLRDVEHCERYRFVHGDIADAADVRNAIGSGVDAIVNFAAETHVDRSLLDAAPFYHTNVLGVKVLLEAAYAAGVGRFLQVSTDEVYGTAPAGEFFTEESPLNPSNPYSRSKAEGGQLALVFGEKHGLPVLITRGSNTYGPYQYPEKLIPLFVTNLIENRPVPVYGDGLQVRDWLHAEDHARGVLHILEHGEPGNTYNLSGNNYRTNLDITRKLVAACGRSMRKHVQHVTDRINHDRRYAMNGAKAQALGWEPRVPFDDGLLETVEWYKSNEAWWRPLKRLEARKETA